jgi:hypothetical protein
VNVNASANFQIPVNGKIKFDIRRGESLTGIIDERLGRFMLEAGFAYYDSDVEGLNQGHIAIHQSYTYRGPTYLIIHVGPDGSLPPMIAIPNNTHLVKFIIRPYEAVPKIRRFGRG